MVHVSALGQLIEPCNQLMLFGPVRLIWPVAVGDGGAQMSWLVQDRSPFLHHSGAEVQLVGRTGATPHGAENQVRLFGGSAAALAGSEPNLHGLAQLPPPPAAQVFDENPAAFTNSSVTADARRVPPLRQIPPPPANPEPLK